MSKTIERTAVNITAKHPNGVAPRPQAKVEPLLLECLRFLASLKITVVLMALSILLVFFGTLAQVDQGIGTVLLKYFRTLVALIPLQVFVRFAQVFFHVKEETVVSGAFPFPGGWLLGGLLLINLLAAHAVRFRLTWKRSGILILHSGVVVIMVSELITGLCAVESHMTIALGETVNYADVTHLPVGGGRPIELALIDKSDAAKDHVVVVPGDMLRQGETISNPLLKVDVEVVEYMPNSELLQLGPMQNNHADIFVANNGQRCAIVTRAEESGVDSGGRDDAASVRVTLRKKDTHEPLGTYLLSLWFYPNYTVRRFEFPDETFHLDNKTYTVSLRPRREYKPYSLQLTDFTHARYPGTDIPKDYRSSVHLKDPQAHEDRNATIYMNNPLDYSDVTFYQAGFFPDDSGTVLQVVHNPGSAMPWLACLMVASGMLIHFGIHLFGFIRKTLQAGLGAGSYIGGRTEKPLWVRLVPVAVVLCFAAYLTSVMIPKRGTGKMHIADAAKIPVQDGGRIKPLDTFARTSLMIISNRSTFVGADKKEHSAIEWLLDVMAGGQPNDDGNRASHYEIFRIENLQLLDFLKLKYKPGWYRYSILELTKDKPDNFDALEKEGARALKVDEKKRDVFDVKVLELGKHLELYLRLCQLREPHFVPAGEGEDWRSLAAVEGEIRTIAFPRVREAAKQQGIEMADVANMPQDKQAKLMSILQTELRRAHAEAAPSAAAMTEIVQTYRNEQPDEFNDALAGYLTSLNSSPDFDMTRIRTETLFDRVEPFYLCVAFYGVVFTLGFIGLLVSAFSEAGGEAFRKAAFWLALATLVLHSAALVTRMYIQGRPPVTNLYSAAVWISWGCVLLGLVLEGLFRNGIGNIVAAVPGVLSMLLAHHLAGSGDTLEMMQAVLDTNFWLATHVTVVTFGYVATVVAGVIGLIYVLIGVLTPGLDRDKGKVLGQMIYGVLCFATLLSFTGTVLGGLWADYSWGRFWGWDPKENGALIIVLWNVLILHARWGGMIKQRGMAVLSIVGIIVTGWSFIGTNQLGVGLHAYGFNNTLATILVDSWGICLGLIFMGSLPKKWWISNRFAS